MKCSFLFVVAVLVLSEIGAYPQLQRQQAPRGQGQIGGPVVQASGRERGIGEGGKSPGQEEPVQGHDVGQDHVHEEGEVHGQEAEPPVEPKEEQDGEKAEEGKVSGQDVGQGVGEEGGHGEGREERPVLSEEPKVSGGEGKHVAGAGEGNSVRENGGAGIGVGAGVGARGVASGRSGRT